MNTNMTTRKPGRPAKSSQESDRREALLDAAEFLFARQGLSGTSIREVAELSNSNPALVHYYFGNKQALVIAVMERVMEPMAKAMQSLGALPGNPLENVVRLMIQTMQKHPALPQLMVREVFLPGGVLQEYFIEHFAPRLGGALPGLIAALQNQGMVDPKPDPARVALTLIGYCVFPFIARPLAEKVMKIDYSPASQDLMIEHTMNLLKNGVML
jgi:TetR/AcrR family transcriptional regulator